MFRALANRLSLRSLMPFTVVSPTGATCTLTSASASASAYPFQFGGPGMLMGMRHRSNRGELTCCEDISRIFQQLQYKRLTPNFPDLPKSRLNSSTKCKALVVSLINRTFATNHKNLMKPLSSSTLKKSKSKSSSCSGAASVAVTGSGPRTTSKINYKVSTQQPKPHATVHVQSHGHAHPMSGTTLAPSPTAIAAAVPNINSRKGHLWQRSTKKY